MLGDYMICMGMCGNGVRIGYDELFTGNSTDPQSASAGESRVLRGGSFNCALLAYSASRIITPSDARLKINGFRLARTL